MVTKGIVLALLPVFVVSFHASCHLLGHARSLLDRRWWSGVLERFAHLFVLLPLIICLYAASEVGFPPFLWQTAGSSVVAGIVADIVWILLFIFGMVYLFCIHLLFQGFQASEPSRVELSRRRHRILHMILIPYAEWLLMSAIILRWSTP